MNAPSKKANHEAIFEATSFNLLTFRCIQFLQVNMLGKSGWQRNDAVQRLGQQLSGWESSNLKLLLGNMGNKKHCTQVAIKFVSPA